MEFACELLRLEDCVVDAVTQAVFADGETVCSDVSWLHPRGEVLGGPPTTTAFVDRGVLAPMTGSWNVFYLLMELAAGLRVADRGGVLAGSTLVGWLPEGADRRVPEVAGLYGCAVRPRPGRAGRYTRVGTLFVPRFWIRAAGSAEGHFDVPRWAAAGYSRDLLADLRSRLLPVPAPRPSVVAYGRRAAGDADDTLTDVEYALFADTRISLTPPAVTAKAGRVSIGSSITIASLVTATDPAGGLVTQYELVDNTNGAGSIMVGGVAQSAGAVVSLSAAAFAGVTFAASSLTSLDELSVRAYNGVAWSRWIGFIVSSRPANRPPTVQGDKTLTALEAGPAIALGIDRPSDPDEGDSMTVTLTRLPTAGTLRLANGTTEILWLLAGLAVAWWLAR